MRHTNRFCSRHRLVAGVGLAGAMLLLTACAATPKAPLAALTEAKVAISTAERAGASRFSGPELGEARQKLAQADDAVAEAHMIEADRLAQQSRAAAELATAKTETVKAEAVNMELREGLEALNEELNRPGDKG